MTKVTRRNALGGLAVAIASAGAARAAPAARPAREKVFAAQTRWAPPPPLKPLHEGLAALPGTRLWYQDTGGGGAAVVLLHAWTGSYASWGYQQAPLAAAGYRVISYSMRGHDRSDPIDPANPDTATGDLRALLDYLKIGRAHLIGSAGGALPALDFGLSDPARALSMTLSSSILGISDPEFLAVSAGMFPKGVYPISHAFSELGPSYRAGYPQGVAAWEELDRTAWQGGTARQPVGGSVTFARLATLKVPTLLITGDADLMMPPSRIRAVARKMPPCELAFVAEAGHSLHWEQPDAFNTAILAFIQRH